MGNNNNIKKQIIIKSRYRENIYFNEIENGYIFSFDTEYCRIGFTDDYKYNFIDPSGGPFISIDTDLHKIYEKLQGIVKEININDENLILLITSL